MLGFNREIERSQDLKLRTSRLFLLDDESVLEKKVVQGALLMMPDRTHLPIVDMNLVSFVVSQVGYNGKARVGQVLDCKLKIQGMWQPIELCLRVVRLKAKEIFLQVDHELTKNRVAIEQKMKDQLILSALQRRGATNLEKQYLQSNWWHSIFDTNFLFSKNQQGQIEQAVIEYDGLCLKYADGEWSFKKSIPATVENSNYSSLWSSHDEQKVSMGTSWTERLVRLLTEGAVTNPELIIFIKMLSRDE